jgi:hypothetical protein
MSYAGPATSSRGSSRPSTPAGRPAAGRPNSRHAPEPQGETDWERVAIFGVGLALGVAVGAGAALLTAPQTGAETRAALLARAGRLRRTTRRRGRDAWDELRDEIRGVKRSLRRRRALREQDAEAASE